MARATSSGSRAKGMRHSAAHPGFHAVQEHIAAEYGGNMKKAGAILGSKTRGASKAAKKRNPRLKRVKG